MSGVLTDASMCDAQATYFTFRYCFLGGEAGHDSMESAEKPSIVRVKSAELLYKTGSPFGAESSSNPAAGL